MKLSFVTADILFLFLVLYTSIAYSLQPANYTFWFNIDALFNCRDITTPYTTHRPLRIVWCQAQINN